MEGVFKKERWKKSLLGKHCTRSIFYNNPCFVVNTKLTIEMSASAMNRWKNHRSHKLATGVRVHI